MRIFYANRSQLNDPDKIQVGQQLIIPPDDKA
jgi:nucleoid-associated protein YgaU